MRINQQPGSGNGSGVFNVIDGGVGDLDLVTFSELNQPNGFPLSTLNNLIDPRHVNLNAVYYRVCLDGPIRVKYNTETTWKITNKNLARGYASSTSDGLVNVQGNIVRFTANKVGSVKFNVDGREFTVLCTDEIVDRPIINYTESFWKRKNIDLESSDFVSINFVDTHDFTEWEMSFDADFENIVEESRSRPEHLQNWNLTGLQLDKIYYVRVRYKGHILEDFSEWSFPAVIKTPARADVSVTKPSIMAPSNNENNVLVRPLIRSTGFSVNNWEDGHVYSEWQIASNANFTNIVMESGQDTNSLEAWNPPMLPINTVLYARVRHAGGEFQESLWSDTTVFRTENLAVNQPSITSPVNGKNDVTYTTTITSSAFNKIGGITHVSSSWEISSNASFTSVVKSASQDTGSKTSWNVEGLLPNTTYYVRVRHHSEDGISSDWSLPNTFVTEELRVDRPSVTAPQHGSTSSSIELSITSTAFSSNYNFTHKNTDWQISANDTFTALVNSSVNDATNKVAWNPGRLNVNTTYYVRVRHRSNTDLTSAWSPTLSFTTRHMSVSKPNVTSPVNNAQEHTFTFTATSSAFEQVGELVQSGSTWQIATNASFTNMVATVTNSEANKTSWNITGLLPSTDYYIRVKHHSTLDVNSDWSNAVTIRTMAAMVVKPSVSTPTANQTIPYGDTVFKSSAFSQIGGLVHESSEWEIATDANFTNVVASSDSTADKTTWTVKVS